MKHLLPLLVVATLALAQEPPLPAKPLSIGGVRDISGKSHSLPAKDADATVVIFVMTDCPIANRMAPEIARICKEYRAKRVSMFLAYVDPELAKEQISDHLKKYQLPCTGIADSKQRLVKALGASITPQAAVLDRKGMLVYRGRINDLFEDHGKPRQKPRTNDLRDALDEVLAGKPVTNPLVPPIGCYIPPPP